MVVTDLSRRNERIGQHKTMQQPTTIQCIRAAGKSSRRALDVRQFTCRAVQLCHRACVSDCACHGLIKDRLSGIHAREEDCVETETSGFEMDIENDAVDAVVILLHCQHAVCGVFT